MFEPVCRQARYSNIFGTFHKKCAGPRIGDDFDMPFLRAFNNGRGDFFGSRIQHQLNDTTLIITIWLEAGIYNSYAKFKEDKDEFENRERWLRRIKNEQY